MLLQAGDEMLGTGVSPFPALSSYPLLSFRPSAAGSVGSSGPSHPIPPAEGDVNEHCAELMRPGVTSASCRQGLEVTAALGTAVLRACYIPCISFSSALPSLHLSLL